MKKEITIIPDKIIKLSAGDSVEIFVNPNNILFEVYCNGNGCIFTLTKDELKEMMDGNK